MCDAGLRRIYSSVIGAEIGGYIDDALNWAGPSSYIDYGVTASYKLFGSCSTDSRARACYDGCSLYANDSNLFFTRRLSYAGLIG